MEREGGLLVPPKLKPKPKPKPKVEVDTGEDMIGKHFYDDELGFCEVMRVGVHDNHRVLWYKHQDDTKTGTNDESFSSVEEVREWCGV